MLDYKVVDVFTATAFKGNPVAVVLDASELSTQQMQQIAHWTNLSETTFVVPKTHDSADYKVRIFTPLHELPFAGHPSLGTAHALREAGLVDASKDKLVQECARGLIEINVSKNEAQRMLSFGISEIEAHDVLINDVRDAFPGLHIISTPSQVNTGPSWIAVEVENSSEELLNYKPNMQLISELSEKLSASGVCIFARQFKHDIQLRTFAPSVGVNEDPVCGSGNAAVAHYRNLQSAYVSYQGGALGRDGIIQCGYRHGKIWVGGPCVTVVNGTLNV